MPPSVQRQRQRVCLSTVVLVSTRLLLLLPPLRVEVGAAGLPAVAAAAVRRRLGRAMAAVELIEARRAAALALAAVRVAAAEAGVRTPGHMAATRHRN